VGRSRMIGRSSCQSSMSESVTSFRACSMAASSSSQISTIGGPTMRSLYSEKARYSGICPPPTEVLTIPCKMQPRY